MLPAISHNVVIPTDRRAARHRRWCALLILWAVALGAAPAAHAGPQGQDGPAAQCAEGLRLFFDEQPDKALPLLAAGFAGRDQGDFVRQEDLGMCALGLGLIRGQRWENQAALEALNVALEIFQQSNDHTWEANTLNTIGTVYRNQGRYVDALEAYQQALVSIQESADRAGEGRTLANIGGVYMKQGRYVEALETLQQALAILRKVGARIDEGVTLNSIGLAYHSQGRYVEALEALQESLAIMREQGIHEGEGIALSGIGGVYADQERYSEALEALQQALTIQQQAGDRHREGIILGNMGVIYTKQGRYVEALETLQQALAIQQELDARADECMALNHIGVLYENQGRHVEALDVYQQALIISREVGSRADEGMTLANLGTVYEAQGRYAEALEALQQALTIVRETGDRQGEGATLNNIGTVYSDQGQYAEALDSYTQSLAIRRELGDRHGEGTNRTNIGTVYLQQGRYAEALEAYTQALVIMREVGGRVKEGTILNNMGTAYGYQRRYAEALDAHQQSLAIRRQTGDRAGEAVTLTNMGADYADQGRYAEALEAHRQALTIAQELGARLEQGIILNNMGKAYASQGQYAEALEAYRQAMTLLEDVRASAGSEQGRAGFIAQYAQLYTRAALLAHQQGEGDIAFQISERGRARAFLDSLATGHVQLADNDSQELLTKEQETYATRQATQDALADARAADPPDAALIADLEQQLAAAEQAHADALQAIEDRGGQLAALVPARTSGVLGVAEVQALLDPDTTLISYFVGEERSLAFVLTHDTFTTVELPVGEKTLRAQVEALRAFPTLDAAQPASARQLYDALIAPLKPHLTTPHLALIPHSVLHYLPFAALSDGQRFLIDDYTLSVLPSASSLPFIEQNAVGRTPAAPLILGNPTTNAGTHDPDSPELRPLAAAEGEARAIAGMYGATPLLGADASEAALQAGASSAGMVHLAAHAEFNPVAPLGSAIYLAPAGDMDGRLEAGEIYDLDLRQADLVVLSACQTQLGELSAGDELVGMTRAFVFAGAPSVISTLWSVDDQTTADLMRRFYTHLRAGASKAAALRLAQQELRKDHPSPYYWAGFVLSGDPGQSEPAPLWPWLAGGGLLLAAIIGGRLLHIRRQARPATQAEEPISA